MKIYKLSKSEKRASYDVIGDIKEINKNIDRFLETTQNRDFTHSDFAVDLRSKRKAVPQNVRKAINNILHQIGLKYWQAVPVEQIMSAFTSNDVVPLQEDGTKWAGMLGTQGECGGEHDPILIELAVKDNNEYVLAKNRLVLTTCTMPSGHIEIVTYIS